MKTKPCYYVGTHEKSFRPGERAKITGVRMVTPDVVVGTFKRPCFVIAYNDGVVDHVPIGDIGNYRLE